MNRKRVKPSVLLEFIALFLAQKSSCFEWFRIFVNVEKYDEKKSFL